MINFNAGPGKLPLSVKEILSQQILAYKDSGFSILELPHRSVWIDELVNNANILVNKLCEIDNAFDCIWLQGGGRHQFSMLPMNFSQSSNPALYINTGYWSEQAYKSAQHHIETDLINVAIDDTNFMQSIERKLSEREWSYVHLTSNNTVEGIQWAVLPRLQNVIRVYDMSSDFLGLKRDFNQVDIFYAVAQKNIGIAGITLVGIRKGLKTRFNTQLPPALSYTQQIQHDSRVNTIPALSLSAAHLMLEWINEQSVSNVYLQNQLKAAHLYNFIDESSLYTNNIPKSWRSNMNITFSLSNSALEAAFDDFISRKGIYFIKGHRSTGAYRISCYNAITMTEVKYLVNCMLEFESTHK